MYNKLILSSWFGLHLLIVSVLLFVILFNRSSMSNFLKSAWNDESHDKFDAGIQGEVFSIF